MDNLDDSENNAKISDSAYSNSCSNSRSRRSRSSTHSGSHSSGSSGYGGKPSTSGSSNAVEQPTKKTKESKKKKQSKSQVKAVQESAVAECKPPDPVPSVEPKEETNVTEAPAPVVGLLPEKVAEVTEITTADHNFTKEEEMHLTLQTVALSTGTTGKIPLSSDGFSCVISMHDGVVMYTTNSLTNSLGFPKEMWIGRSFIDFVHPKDRNTFASQITTGLAVPNIGNGTQEIAKTPTDATCTMVCRIRRYRGLQTGFGVKDHVVTFMPFLLKFTFKNVKESDGKLVYLVIQATSFYSAFKIPNELVSKAPAFMLRHDAKGQIEYIEPESVPFLGYMPQDVKETNALKLYHPEDLPYIRQIYETIVREGSCAKSKSFRMMVQNGGYVDMETEWSSFINPWSLKLEFVIGKHQVLKGPTNPDVFQTPLPENNLKLSEEDRNKAEGVRESIVRIMNEGITKPAEAAKQQMNKRCQDLALYMEQLIDAQPKTEENTQIEIQDPDYSYYERDSVMLGGISPHHDYNDSKSSTETPLSYNQLNYNDNLKRYFDSHQPYCYEDYNTVDGENILGLNKNAELTNRKCLTPLGQKLADSTDVGSSCDSSDILMVESTSQTPPLRNYQSKLTENLLKKHNTEMEKELEKIHRETRTSSKGDIKKESNESRKNKKAHLARCNAAYHPTLPVASPEVQSPLRGNTKNTECSHGVKRMSKTNDSQPSAHKYHCSLPQELRRRQETIANAQSSATLTTTVANCNWPPNPVNNMNTFILGVGIPQQMQMMNPMSAVPGVIPMYYASPAPRPSTSTDSNADISPSAPFRQQPMPCMMYGQTMYGQPFMYQPVNHQVSYPGQQTLMAQTLNYSNTLNQFPLNSNNYEQACMTSRLEPSNSVAAALRNKKRVGTEPQTPSPKADRGSCPAPVTALHRSTEAVPCTSTAIRGYKINGTTTCEDTVDRTDGESSYSSFYSSFFKTESGSAEESSGDRKKGNAPNNNRVWGNNYSENQLKEVSPARRKTESPWMEQVCVTSQLIYKYQILSKPLEEVLLSDKEKISALEQPSLVNEQLSQLYMDLQLEGVATRLTLEDGITSSSSSGEESTSKPGKTTRRKREYSRLTMIYEEDAPLPPPDSFVNNTLSPGAAVIPS